MVSEHKLGESLGVTTYYNIACAGYDRTPQYAATLSMN